MKKQSIDDLQMVTKKYLQKNNPQYHLLAYEIINFLEGGISRFLMIGSDYRELIDTQLEGLVS